VSRAIDEVDWPIPDGLRGGEEYDRYAAVYDVLYADRRDDAEFYRRTAARLLPPGGTVLELGAGTGRVTEELLRDGYRVVAVEASAEMLARARRKLGDVAGFEPVHAAMQHLRLDRRFQLAVAPYAVVAHLLTDEDRLAAYRSTCEHLEPGGTFVFDDLPSWLSGPSDGTRLEPHRAGVDPTSGLSVRLLANAFDVAGQPFTVRYEFVDWLSGDEVVKRVVIRAVFRNVSLDEELRLLRAAGFESVEVLGGFDGRPFDAARPEANERLVLVARRGR
jgi:SAM-dependent methyltransferase